MEAWRPKDFRFHWANALTFEQPPRLRAFCFAQTARHFRDAQNGGLC